MLQATPQVSGASVNALLHDQPRFGIAGELYSQVFYDQLARVLRSGGRLFHYTGSPNTLTSGRNLPHEVARRLGKQDSSQNWRWMGCWGCGGMVTELSASNLCAANSAVTQTCSETYPATLLLQEALRGIRSRSDAQVGLRGKKPHCDHTGEQHLFRNC